MIFSLFDGSIAARLCQICIALLHIIFALGPQGLLFPKLGQITEVWVFFITFIADIYKRCILQQTMYPQHSIQVLSLHWLFFEFAINATRRVFLHHRETDATGQYTLFSRLLVTETYNAVVPCNKIAFFFNPRVDETHLDKFVAYYLKLLMFNVNKVN